MVFLYSILWLSALIFLPKGAESLGCPGLSEEKLKIKKTLLTARKKVYPQV